MENTPSQPTKNVPSAHEEQELLTEHAGPSHTALTHDEKPAYSGPITAILQWLSYAFWGWVAVAVAALVSVLSNYVLNGYDGGLEPIAYIVASALVLTPIAVVCDVLFSKREEDHKRGLTMVIMVIHAVLYALLAVAALATTVFSLINLVLSDSSDSTTTISLAITAATLVVFYSLLFIRIIKPAVKTKLRLFIRLILVAIVLGAVIWSIAGPVTQTYLRKDDRRAASAVQLATVFVDSYLAEEKKLPETLEDAIAANSASFPDSNTDQLRGAAEDGLVTYTPNTKAPEVKEATAFETSGTTTYFYELCVTYKFDDPSRESMYGAKMPVDTDGYMHGLSGTSSKAGTHCYDLKAVTSDDGVAPDAARP